MLLSESSDASADIPHELRETEVYRQTVSALHLENDRTGVTLLKGSLSTDQPIVSNELR